MYKSREVSGLIFRLYKVDLYTGKVKTMINSIDIQAIRAHNHTWDDICGVESSLLIW